MHTRHFPLTLHSLPTQFLQSPHTLHLTSSHITLHSSPLRLTPQPLCFLPLSYSLHSSPVPLHYPSTHSCPPHPTSLPPYHTPPHSSSLTHSFVCSSAYLQSVNSISTQAAIDLVKPPSQSSQCTHAKLPLITLQNTTATFRLPSRHSSAGSGHH